jgi:hypothetical protein
MKVYKYLVISVRLAVLYALSRRGNILLNSCIDVIVFMSKSMFYFLFLRFSKFFSVFKEISFTTWISLSIFCECVIKESNNYVFFIIFEEFSPFSFSSLILSFYPYYLIFYSNSFFYTLSYFSSSPIVYFRSFNI